MQPLTSDPCVNDNSVHRSPHLVHNRAIVVQTLAKLEKEKPRLPKKGKKLHKIAVTDTTTAAAAAPPPAPAAAPTPPAAVAAVDDASSRSVAKPAAAASGDKAEREEDHMQWSGEPVLCWEATAPDGCRILLRLSYALIESLSLFLLHT